MLQLRRFSLSWWNGGYADQPHFLMKELNAAAEAEAEFAYQKKLAEARRKKFEEQFRAKTNAVQR